MISVLHVGTVDYATALQLQRSLVDLRKQNLISDVLLLLEHPPVITFGRNASQKNLLASKELLKVKGVELFESNRGGDVTFHGPGQLVGYPIFDLRRFSPRMGAVEFVRKVEEALIRTCGDLAIPCERICGLTGVWTQAAGLKHAENSESDECGKVSGDESRKIAAIGVHISRGVTSHGFALNVTTDLDFFKLIVPCGIGDRPVTSIAHELEGKRLPKMEEVANLACLNFGRVFSRQMLWLESLDSLLHTAAEQGKPAEQDDDKASTTIGIPLKVPDHLRELRQEQEHPHSGPRDEIAFG